MDGVGEGVRPLPEGNGIADRVRQFAPDLQSLTACDVYNTRGLTDLKMSITPDDSGWAILNCRVFFYICLFNTWSILHVLNKYVDVNEGIKQTQSLELRIWNLEVMFPQFW